MKIPLLFTNGMVIIFLFVFLIFFRVRYYCETGDVQGTLSKMPSYKVRETLVLKGLHRHGTDMVSQSIPLTFFMFLMNDFSPKIYLCLKVISL